MPAITTADVAASSRSFCAAVDALNGPDNWTDDRPYPRTRTIQEFGGCSE